MKHNKPKICDFKSLIWYQISHDIILIIHNISSLMIFNQSLSLTVKYLSDFVTAVLILSFFQQI